MRQKKFENFYKYPKVSIVVVTYNNERIIHECIRSVLKNNYPNYELIIVDNGSTDGTLKAVKELINKFNAWNKTKIIVNRKNLGISKASNIGVLFSRGKYIAFLDSDASVHPNWLFQPIEIMEKDMTVAAVQSKILKADPFMSNGLNKKKEEIIDSAGGFMDLTFNIYVRGKNEIDRGQYNRIEEIFYPTHTGSIIRKDVFIELGGFDDLFFIDFHDVDFGWRLWMSGYRIVFAYKSIVYHIRGGSRKKLSHHVIRNYKNYLLTVMKNISNNAILIRYVLYYLFRTFNAILKHENKVALRRFLSLIAVLRSLGRIYSKKKLLKKSTKSELGRILWKGTSIVLKKYSKYPLRYRLFVINDIRVSSADIYLD